MRTQDAEQQNGPAGKQEFAVLTGQTKRKMGELSTKLLTGRGHEAEMFDLRLATDVRVLHRARHHPDLRRVAGRIADSLGRGPWT